MIFCGLMIFLVVPVTLITLYAALYHYKEKKILGLIVKIRNVNSDKKAKEEAAAQIIRIIHKNKRLIPPRPISIGINDPNGTKVAFYILKAEITNLIASIQEIRKQNSYVHSASVKMRADVLSYIDEVNRFFVNIDTPHLNFEFKTLLLAKLYRTAVVAYLSLPDEKGHQEVKFIPLLEIVDKAPTRNPKIFPIFLEWVPLK